MLSQILNHAWHPGVRDLILTFSSVTFEVEPLLHSLMVEYIIYFLNGNWLLCLRFFNFAFFVFLFLSNQNSDLISKTLSFQKKKLFAALFMYVYVVEQFFPLVQFFLNWYRIH